ncbi:hypothetical protein SLS58_004134 [Diplodia intermedia]|uniref:Uncharacterized protein n=1 Tax=Diplodia intermedia TaxID=856260 RepID=A0ABR3TUY7_9PEZI
MAEQDPDPRSMMPPNAHPEVNSAAIMLGAAEDADSSMPVATQVKLLEHISTARGCSEYKLTDPHSYISSHPQLVESCAPYPFRSGPNFRAYHAQKSAAWSPDGKCILQLGEDKCLRAHAVFRKFVWPLLYGCLDNLSKAQQPLSHLIGVHEAPETIGAFAASPYFNCDEPESMLVLASVKEEPIRLFNVNNPGAKLHASYHVLYETDDVMHVTVDCIKFLPDTVHFLAAGDNCLALFDITRYDAKPVVQLYTHNKYRKKNRLNPLALGGRISTVDYRDDGLLAVGSWASRIGFYDDFGKGEVLAIDQMSDTRGPGFADGIQTVRWSPDGNYLYVAEPNTDFITILDVRMAGRKVTFLTGRNAWSKQRHGFDLVFDDNGHHVIAGGSDGAVRVWHNPTRRSEGNTGPSIEWQAHDDHIAAVAVNPRWADVVATTAGSRHFPVEEDYDTSDSSDADEDSVTVDNSSEVEPRRNGGANELNAPVPDGWMKIWRC